MKIEQHAADVVEERASLAEGKAEMEEEKASARALAPSVVDLPSANAPAPVTAPASQCAAGPRYMAPPDIPFKSSHTCNGCRGAIHCQTFCGDDVASLQDRAKGYDFGYLHHISPYLQEKIRAGTPDLTNLAVC